MPADITVFKIEDDEIEAPDTYGDSRVIGQQFKPVMAFKNGIRYDSDLELCQDNKNWMLVTAEDHIPEAVNKLSSEQLEFLQLLARDLEARKWKDYTLKNLDLDEAESLQRLFHKSVGRQQISLRDALLATFACFLDEPFTVQIGLFLLMMNHEFTLKRIRDVIGSRQIAA